MVKRGDIRIDSVAAKDGVWLCSDIDVDAIMRKLNENGIVVSIGTTPTKYLCNEAYWYMLNKYDKRVVFFHIPSIGYITEEYIEKVKNAI